ncbi:MAG: DUF2284 domain-containing protein [Lachnospiraceae bacterium]|nr:DUF2284 domain-containing protein [Lachnospiraceae bacterium]
MEKHSALIQEMIKYFAGDPKRIQHFMKVYSFASLIADCEDLDEKTRFILETAAVVHDIGIKVSEEKYGNCSGKHQEEEGPDAARPLLAKLSYDPPVVDRVCWLIAHHHTYDDIESMDHQILVEADFLVNMYEDELSPKAIQAACSKIFCTPTGIQLCQTMFSPSTEAEFHPDVDRIVSMGADAGFTCTAVINTDQITFNPDFRVCCEDNSCGKYGVNYTCPPDCGTTDQMRDRVLAHKYAIVFQTMWETPDTEDKEVIKKCKGKHNSMIRRFIDELDPSYGGGFMIAASGCSLCQECAIVRGEPCLFPDKAASCASAYCIYVEDLAKKCGMEYDCGRGLTAFFGLYVFG